MEGGFPQRTQQPGQIMFPIHQVEVRDARHGEGAPECQPPSATGDRPSDGDRDPGLIAHSKRPSFLQLLSALWGAEEELKRKRGNEDPKPKRPRSDDTNQEEKP